MRRIALLVIGLFLALPVGAQDPNYVISISNEFGGIGGEATLRNTLDFAGGVPIQGWSWGVCHGQSADLIDIVSVIDGTTTIDLDPDFIAVNTFPGEGWTAGVAIDFFGMVFLQPGDGYELHLPVYELLAEGTATVEFCDTCCSPVVTCEIVDQDQVQIIPTKVNGSIEIGFVAPFVLSAPNTASAPGTTISVPLEINAPLGADAFYLGLTHDPAIASVVSIEPGADLSATNGGAGPDFFDAVIDPDGMSGGVVGCIVSVMSEFDTLPVGEDVEIATFEYQVSASAPDGSSTPLDFTDGPGDPPIPMTITVAGESTTPLVESGLLTASGMAPTEVEFVRGDTDADGAILLQDGVLILVWTFGSGSPPTCEKTADVDDDGVVNGLLDGTYLLNFLFSNGADPLPPLDSCGTDPTADDLPCDAFAGC